MEICFKPCLYPTDDYRSICGDLNCNDVNHQTISLKKFKKLHMLDEDKLCSKLLDDGNLCCQKIDEIMCPIHMTKKCDKSNRNNKLTTSKRCIFNYNFEDVFKKNPFMCSTYFVNTYFQCFNHTENKNGLCNHHFNNIMCPCCETEISIKNKDSCKNKKIQLGYLLKDIDIIENILKFLNTRYLKILNCTNNTIKNFNLKKNITIFTNLNESSDIIIHVINKLSDIDYCIGYVEKSEICIDIFEYLLYNKKFIFDNIDFSITVLNKLYELKYDKLADHILNFKKKIDYFIKELFNIDDQISNQILEKINKKKWPGKNKNGKCCKNCIRSRKFCYHHK